jgi:hypothetical protein
VIWIEGAALAGLVAFLLRFVLIVRPVPGTKLPRPDKIGLPSGGLASPAAVHAALSRKKS